MSRFPLSQPPSPWSHFANYLESALNRSSSSLSTPLYTPRARIRHETRVRAPVDNRTYPSTAILFQYYAQLPPPTFPPNARRGRRKVSTVSLHRARPNNYCLGESQPRGNRLVQTSLENIHPPSAMRMDDDSIEKIFNRGGAETRFEAPLAPVNWVQVEGLTKLSYLVTKELYLSRPIWRETRNPLLINIYPPFSSMLR